mmetsp:Transcript_7813/g.15069  ORF Transcript_7813/g.15069 Transcript_7813/m.15069 type:complete len:334 (+) Transcript_7813:648-1649(+)
MSASRRKRWSARRYFARLRELGEVVSGLGRRLLWCASTGSSTRGTSAATASATTATTATTASATTAVSAATIAVAATTAPAAAPSALVPVAGWLVGIVESAEVEHLLALLLLLLARGLELGVLLDLLGPDKLAGLEAALVRYLARLEHLVVKLELGLVLLEGEVVRVFLDLLFLLWEQVFVELFSLTLLCGLSLLAFGSRGSLSVSRGRGLSASTATTATLSTATTSTSAPTTPTPASTAATVGAGSIIGRNTVFFAILAPASFAMALLVDLLSSAGAAAAVKLALRSASASVGSLSALGRVIGDLIIALGFTAGLQQRERVRSSHSAHDRSE